MDALSSHAPATFGVLNARNFGGELPTAGAPSRGAAAIIAQARKQVADGAGVPPAPRRAAFKPSATLLPGRGGRGGRAYTAPVSARPVPAAPARPGRRESPGGDVMLLDFMQQADEGAPMDEVRG